MAIVTTPLYLWSSKTTLIDGAPGEAILHVVFRGKLLTTGESLEYSVDYAIADITVPLTQTDWDTIYDAVNAVVYAALAGNAPGTNPIDIT